MKKRVYLETTIVSYLASRPSRDLVLAAHQEITREWWENRRLAFHLHVSQYVNDEAAEGDIVVDGPQPADKLGSHHGLEWLL